MNSRAIRVFVLAALAFPAAPRQDPSVCGTAHGNWREERFLHRQVLRARARQVRSAVTVPRAAALGDAGNIALLDDSAGAIARRNPFDLDYHFLAFTPTGAGYRYDFASGGWDDDAAAAGVSLDGLGDDDSRAVDLPFAFPFYGSSYSQVHVNSDGNLTFAAADSSSSDRSVGRMTAGPPRISPLFDDLDPTQSAGGVRVLAEPGRVTVTWLLVPEWRSETGFVFPQSFQVRLFPDGRIEFAYRGVSASDAVTGIAPGGLAGTPALVSFAADPPADYAGAVLERFGGTLAVDMASAAQQFYRSHEDAYDYLVIFNNVGVAAGASALAFETTVRNNRSGYGDEQVDIGREFGSTERLQAVLNLGPLSQYPADPDTPVWQRPSGDTPVTIVAHEAGHLFLAYASVLDPDDPDNVPMLGYQNAHWFFGFNSEASLLEGNRIQDRGVGSNPRFLTTGTVEGYSPLDQYLMGFRAPEDVEPSHQMFWVSGTPASYKLRSPQRGIAFNGARHDVRIAEVIDAVGRRTPDYTVAQRRFRFAFMLIVPQGTQPSDAEFAKLESFRTEFESFYQAATDNRAVADTALRLNLRLSVSPAAGVIAGREAAATVTVDTPPEAPLAIALGRQTGVTSAPDEVVIPAGETSAQFTIAGLTPGVEEFLATPADPRYHVAAARIQVAAAEGLNLVPVTAGSPLVVRLTDANKLPYPGARLLSIAADGTVMAEAITAADGTASFEWSGTGTLTIALEGAGQVSYTISNIPPE